MNIEQYKKYLVTEKQGDRENVHLDRCTYVWETFYEPCYLKMNFWKTTNFKNYKKRGKNKGKHQGYIFKDDFEVCISGDTLFNFKEGIKVKNQQKYEYFKELILKDFSGENRQKYLDELEFCKSMFHSFHNFALMPQTGAMNNFKGMGSYTKDGCQSLDRLDRFLYYLDQYYNDSTRSIDNPIFSEAHGQDSKKHTAEENTVIIKNALKQFLDPIGSVYKYCEYFYLIKEKDFIDRLIKNGKTAIDSGTGVVAYMGLAKEFWAKRHEIIKELG